MWGRPAPCQVLALPACPPLAPGLTSIRVSVLSLAPLLLTEHSRTFHHHLPAIISFCHCERRHPAEGRAGFLEGTAGAGGLFQGPLALLRRAHPLSRLSPSLASQAGPGRVAAWRTPRDASPARTQANCSWPFYNLPELSVPEFVCQLDCRVTLCWP